MKALILTLVAGLLLFAATSLGMRFLPPKEAAKSLLWLYLALLCVLIVAFYLLPADLGFLGSRWIASIPAVEFGFAVFLYSAGFFGGLLQLYNLADRGLSLRMLIDILESPRGRMTVDELARGYGAGRGIAWMYEKRLEGMSYAGLAERQNGQIVLSSRGWKAARFFAPLHSRACVTPSE